LGFVDPQTLVRGVPIIPMTALIVVTSVEGTRIVVIFGTVGLGRRRGIVLTHQFPPETIPLD